MLHGDLAQILCIAEAAQTQDAHRVVGGRSGDVLGRLSVVAGARNTLHLLTAATAHPPRNSSSLSHSDPRSNSKSEAIGG